MKKHIATILMVLVIFVGGFFLGRWTEVKRQEAICGVAVLEAEKRWDQDCESRIAASFAAGERSERGRQMDRVLERLK
jgi:hypothetical protein